VKTVPQFYIVAGAVPDDGGYYIYRKLTPYCSSPEDQYHEFGNEPEDFKLFSEMLKEFADKGDVVLSCPPHLRYQLLGSALL